MGQKSRFNSTEGVEILDLIDVSHWLRSFPPLGRGEQGKRWFIASMMRQFQFVQGNFAIRGYNCGLLIANPFRSWRLEHQQADNWIWLEHHTFTKLLLYLKKLTSFLQQQEIRIVPLQVVA